MENHEEGKSENEESHYSSIDANTDTNKAKLVKDDGLGQTADQGETDTDSGGLAGNADGNSDAEDQ